MTAEVRAAEQIKYKRKGLHTGYGRIKETKRQLAEALCGLRSPSHRGNEVMQRTEEKTEA